MLRHVSLLRQPFLFSLELVQILLGLLLEVSALVVLLLHQLFDLDYLLVIFFKLLHLCIQIGLDLLKLLINNELFLCRFEIQIPDEKLPIADSADLTTGEDQWIIVAISQILNERSLLVATFAASPVAAKSAKHFWLAKWILTSGICALLSISSHSLYS